VALCADVIAPYDPIQPVPGSKIYAPPFWMPGGSMHALLGTDFQGRDILSRLLFGARVSLIVGVMGTLVADRLGAALGILAVKLAEIAGARRWRVIRRHILPNVLNTTMILASLTIGVVIIAEASLSFLGVGVPPPQPAWGSMLAEARSTLMAGKWWLTVWPGLCILLVVLATQLFGDWLRVRLDPQLRNL